MFQAFPIMRISDTVAQSVFYARKILHVFVFFIRKMYIRKLASKAQNLKKILRKSPQML